MKRIDLKGGFGEFHGGIGYEWESQHTSNPVLDIYGTGNGYAKETCGQVKITGDGTRTVVRVIGSGGWKITGSEEILG